MWRCSKAARLVLPQLFVPSMVTCGIWKYTSLLLVHDYHYGISKWWCSSITFLLFWRASIFCLHYRFISTNHTKKSLLVVFDCGHWNIQLPCKYDIWCLAYQYYHDSLHVVTWQGGNLSNKKEHTFDGLCRYFLL